MLIGNGHEKLTRPDATPAGTVVVTWSGATAGETATDFCYGKQRQVNVLDLFSGIGGFSLGLERAGMRTVAFCEIEPYCRAVLHKHWPAVPIYEDIRELTGDRLRSDGIAADVICGGFPCQDISVAGGGAGLDGARSGLWTEYRRLIADVRPRFVIIENSPALRTRGGDRVLTELEALSYACEPFVVGAVHAGAPHRRQRAWLVAHANGTELRDEQGRRSRAHGRGDAVAGDHGAASHVADSYSVASKQGRTDHAAQGTRGWDADRGCVGADVADADSAGLEIVLDGDARQCAPSVRAHAWSSEPDVGRSIDGFPMWMDRHVGRGLSDAESQRRTQVLRSLWSADVSKALRRSAGGLERFQQAQVLFAFVREYEGGSDQARVLVAGQEASEAFLRELREHACSGGSPYRSGSKQQRTQQHSDLVQPVSRLLACDSEAAWASGGWEDALPRVAYGIPARAHRIKALGNAVVPQIPEAIGRAIMNSVDAPLQKD